MLHLFHSLFCYVREIRNQSCSSKLQALSPFLFPSDWKSSSQIDILDRSCSSLVDVEWTHLHADSKRSSLVFVVRFAGPLQTLFLMFCRTNVAKTRSLVQHLVGTESCVVLKCRAWKEVKPEGKPSRPLFRSSVVFLKYFFSIFWKLS